MNKYLRYILFLLLFCRLGSVVAQKKENLGFVTGTLKDSVKNHVLQSATVALYKVDSNTLISYQLTNNFGKFRFQDLPTDVLLMIVATNVGYKACKKQFILTPQSQSLDLKIVNMESTTDLLEEVMVYDNPPPMQMKGDTLEFNASAFKLDTNAVVGDMIRKLPGVTVWSDGLITVNGKKINKLLVEGKEFFGSDSKIALQNIPKNAVKKVQVYEDANNPEALTPITNMNIVLKKDKKSGYFGKVGGGAGTRNRFDLNGMLNYFSPRTQASIVTLFNNVNKTANNINALIGLNSFKGEGINNNYGVDFEKQGQTDFKAGGVSVSHDFIERRNTPLDSNAIEANYYWRNDKNRIIQNGQKTISINDYETLEQKNYYKNSIYRNTHSNEANYTINRSHFGLRVAYKLLNFETSNESIENISSRSSLTDNRSESLEELRQQQKGADLSASVSLVTHRYMDFGISKKKSLDLELNYTFNSNRFNEFDRRVAEFVADDIRQNKFFNRQYDLYSRKYFHSINANLNNLNNLLKRPIRYFNINFTNSLSFQRLFENNNVSDSTSTAEVKNLALSNMNQTFITDYRTGIDFSRSFKKLLANRYRKSLNMDFFSHIQYYRFNTLSQKLFQNFDNSYFVFLPSAKIIYNYEKFGDFQKSVVIKYNTSSNYPTLQQLAPLIDSANFYYIDYGNANLKPSYKHDLSVTFHYNNDNAKHPFNSNVYLNLSRTIDFISDSSFYDQFGRNIHYFFNVNRSNSYSLGGDLQKAYKLKESQFQFLAGTNYSYYDYPSSLNGQNFFTRNSYLKLSMDVIYSLRDFFVVDFGNVYTKGQIVNGDLNHLSYYRVQTFVNLSIIFYNRVYVHTKVDINKIKTTQSSNIYYTIWNADIALRFLKGRNAELKVLAVDILHQNRNVINYIGGNVFSRKTTNVLQPYFMLTFAYYPRKFGLNKR